MTYGFFFLNNAGLSNRMPDNEFSRKRENNASEDYLRVSCGLAQGYLHLPTMEVIPLNTGNGHKNELEVNKCLTVHEFERYGGRGHGNCWDKSIVVDMGNNESVPLGEYLMKLAGPNKTSFGTNQPQEKLMDGKLQGLTNQSAGALDALLQAVTMESQQRANQAATSPRNIYNVSLQPSFKELHSTIGGMNASPSGVRDRIDVHKDAWGRLPGGFDQNNGPENPRKRNSSETQQSFIEALLASSKSAKVSHPSSFMPQNMQSQTMLLHLLEELRKGNLAEREFYSSTPPKVQPAASKGGFNDNSAFVNSLKLENEAQRARYAFTPGGSVLQDMERQALKNLELRSKQAIISHALQKIEQNQKEAGMRK